MKNWNLTNILLGTYIFWNYYFSTSRQAKISAINKVKILYYFIIFMEICMVLFHTGRQATYSLVSDRQASKGRPKADNAASILENSKKYFSNFWSKVKVFRNFSKKTRICHKWPKICCKRPNFCQNFLKSQIWPHFALFEVQYGWPWTEKTHGHLKLNMATFAMAWPQLGTLNVWRNYSDDGIRRNLTVIWSFSVVFWWRKWALSK